MDRLSYKFYCKGQLVIDFLGVGVTGSPRESFQDLGLSMAGKMYKINTIQSLENLVEIRSPAEALNFVRLITSPSTFNIMARQGGRKRQLELIYKESLNKEFVFGDSRRLEGIQNVLNGEYGEYMGVFTRKSRFKKYVVSPRVEYVNGYYRLSRNILREEGRFKDSIYRLEEKVFPNGKYQRISLVPLLKDSDVSAFPYYE